MGTFDKIVQVGSFDFRVKINCVKMLTYRSIKDNIVRR